jgi:hypothetical protein
MDASDRPVTRYVAGKLYLLGACAQRLKQVAGEVRDATGPDLAVCLRRMYDRDSGALSLLFQMRDLAGGVLPWQVYEEISATYFDVRAHAGTGDRDAAAGDVDTAAGDADTVAGDAVRILSMVASLEATILPDWDRRDKVPE